MPIPKHFEIRAEALKLLSGNETLKLKEFEAPLAEAFNLTEEEVNRFYESGNGKIFYDRISWALSYMKMAGVITNPKRGTYQITEEGKKLLSTPEKIISHIDNKVSELKKQKVGENQTEEALIISDETPQEQLQKAFKSIKQTVKEEILETLLSKSPYVFESVVVLLLQKMGYGGEIKDAGKVTQASNDGGIDGMIKEDVLGLGRIYIQAKRYAPEHGISRPDIQGFVGALAVVQSNKGVFITTSYFTKGAIEYAENLNGANNVVLIDGQQLATYIYDYNLGMQVEHVVEVKRLDSDYWDKMN